MNTARLFVAAWPPAEVLDLLEAMPRPDEPGVRYTRRDQWHITLRFVGTAVIDDAHAAFESIVAPVAEAVLGPSVARLGRSIVIVPVQGLDAVASAAVDATAHIGEPPDPRPFTGHVTLARLRNRAACGIAGHRLHATFAVDEIHLVRSRLHPHGARYETLAVKRLSGSA